MSLIRDTWGVGNTLNARAIGLKELQKFVGRVGQLFGGQPFRYFCLHFRKSNFNKGFKVESQNILSQKYNVFLRPYFFHVNFKRFFS